LKRSGGNSEQRLSLQPSNFLGASSDSVMRKVASH
jgi:hypothetical protein